MNARCARGFTYLGLVLLMAIAGIGLLAATALQSHLAQREREAELLFAGNEYLEAIGRYRAAHAGLPDPYPRELGVLLGDPDRLEVRRYLRRLYPDPITGGAEWGVVRSPKGGIMGVHSLSGRRPIKQAGFDLANAAFAGAKAYADWKFVHEAASSAATAAAQGSGAGASRPPQAQTAKTESGSRIPWDPCRKMRETDRGACETMRVVHGEAAFQECAASAAAREAACDAGARYTPGLVLR